MLRPNWSDLVVEGTSTIPRQGLWSLKSFPIRFRRLQASSIQSATVATVATIAAHKAGASS